MKVFSWALMAFGLLLALTGLWAWLPFVSKEMRLDFTGVVVLVVIGAVSYLIGSWLDKRIPPEKTKTVILNPNDISFITKALNKQKRTLLILSISLFAFDILVLFAATHGNDEDDPAPLFVVIFGSAIMLGLFVLAAMLLYKCIKLWNTHETNVFKKLTKTPHLITALTAYFIQKEDAPGKVGLQILAEVNLRDEKLDGIVVSEEQLSLLRQYVRLNSPTAVYKEKEVKLHV